MVESGIELTEEEEAEFSAAEEAYYRGQEKYRQGDLAGALEYLEKSLAAKTHFKTHHVLYRVLLALGRREEALAHLEQGYRTNPRNDRVACDLAIELESSGDRVRAVAILREILRRNDSYRPAQVALRELGRRTNRQVKDAITWISRFAAIQGRVVRRFLELYQPKDREHFRDVPKGTLLLDGEVWAHQRHGAGVRFVSSDGESVNAHQGMAEFPEGFDAGRLVEYLESEGIETVVWGGREVRVELSALTDMVREMAEAGALRPETTHESFPHHLFVLVGDQGGSATLE